MIEGESKILTQGEQILAQAQPEKVNVSFALSATDAAIVRDSVDDFNMQYGLAIPLLDGIQRGITLDEGRKDSTAQLSQREMELVNTVLLIRMRELKEVAKTYPLDVQNAFLNINMAYLKNGGEPSEKFQEFCEGMTR